MTGGTTTGKLCGISIWENAGGTINFNGGTAIGNEWDGIWLNSGTLYARSGTAKGKDYGIYGQGSCYCAKKIYNNSLWC